MTIDCFQVQIKRLSSQWANAYGKERADIIWQLVKRLPDDFMVDSVNYFLGYSRSAPLAKEFEEQMARYETRAAQNRSSGGGAGGFAGLMGSALTAFEATNPDAHRLAMARECVSLVRKKTLGQINMRQFGEGCDMIDQVAAILKRPVVKESR